MNTLLVLTNLPDQARAEMLATALVEVPFRRLRQHPATLPFHLSLEKRGRSGHRAPAAHQDQRRALPGAGSGDPGATSVRNAGDHRRAVVAGLPDCLAWVVAETQAEGEATR